MNTKGIMLLVSLGIVLVAAPFFVRAQQPDVDREMEEAKALYRDGNFAEAIVKLQSAISRLKLLRDIEAKRMQLGDAYLHMSLAYFALDNRGAAKENLKGLLRLDRERRLDPQIYAPPVIALFEEASVEVRQEPAVTTQTSAVRPTPSASPKKGGSKAPLIVLGAGAAIGGAVALAKGGSKAGSSATATPTPAATPTPTAQPTGDIGFISSNPPQGSTLSVARDGAQLTVVASVIYNQSGNYQLSLGDQLGCISGDSVSFALTAGQARTVSVTLSVGSRSACPMLPYAVPGLIATLRVFPLTGQGPILSINLPVLYTVNP